MLQGFETWSGHAIALLNGVRMSIRNGRANQTIVAALLNAECCTSDKVVATAAGIAERTESLEAALEKR